MFWGFYFYWFYGLLVGGFQIRGINDYLNEISRRGAAGFGHMSQNLIPLFGITFVFFIAIAQ